MKVPPITFAVMPGSDDVVLFVMATMKTSGNDLYPWALEKLRPTAVPLQTGVESPSFLAARRLTLPVESFQSEVADDAPGTSRWSVWSRGGQTCSLTKWVREVPGIERLR